MKLENSFEVDAPLDRTWRTLLDIERVATCLPGATIEPGGEGGVYHGAMKMKLGPMTVQYKGTARLQDVDEDTHTASIAVQAREAKGQGTAAAVISNQLEQVNGKTKVTAITDLQITGRQAQFGRGIMEDVAGTMMGQFAERLEAELRKPEPERDAAPQHHAAEERSPAIPEAGQEPDEVLNVGGVLAQTQMVRYGGAAAAGLALVALVVWLLTRGKGKGQTFNVNLRR
jgi:uncharacterized protein